MNHILSRRHFIDELISLGLIGLVSSCKSCKQIASPSSDSPVYLGKYDVEKLTLGVAPGTRQMPYPAAAGSISSGHRCSDGSFITVSTPPSIPVLIYYPTSGPGAGPPISISLNEPKYPVILFGHARRLFTCPTDAPPGSPAGLWDNSLDYTRIDRMLIHAASYGCVIAVPDLSSLVDLGFSERAAILTSLYTYLKTLNNDLFHGRLDMNRIILSGHSTGGGACILARQSLPQLGGPDPRALVLFAPATSSGVGSDISGIIAEGDPCSLLVMKGTLDMQVGSDPLHTYQAAESPKILVTLPGANHFGYTDICTPDNKICAAMEEPGTMIPFTQQLGGGAYLAAMLRWYCRGDATVLPYLNGTKVVEMPIYGLTGVLQEQVGV